MRWGCPACAKVFDQPGRCPEHDTTLIQQAIDPLVGAELGGCTLKARLGGGGMGSVYRAFQHSVGREVAVKVIAPALAGTPGAVERFMREARLAAQVNSPQVVTVLDFGQRGDGLLYLVMELVDGAPLSALMGAGPVEPMRALQLGVQLCEALAAIHALGIVHRDVKPSNVVLVRGARDDVKLLDFGLARAAGDASLTASEQVVGSASYVAPESVRGEAVDARADLYALGGVLYALLEGQAPFGGGDFTQVLQRQLDGELRPWAQPVPQPLQALVERLLDPDPDARPRSAAEVKERLAALNEHVSLTRPVKPAPRWPVAVAAAALAAGVAVAALLYPREPQVAPAPIVVVAPPAVVDAGAAPVAQAVPVDAGAKPRSPSRFERDGLAGKDE
ncbi:MAG: serine/threonine protein kinase [Myxococcaceae bacterium]|nr:serine/threonine protein kinase [Myxococcaceae bacterium]